MSIMCRVALGCNRAADGGGRLGHAESLSFNLAIYYSCGAERWTPIFRKVLVSSEMQQVQKSPAAVH